MIIMFTRDLFIEIDKGIDLEKLSVALDEELDKIPHTAGRYDRRCALKRACRGIASYTFDRIYPYRMVTGSSIVSEMVKNLDHHIGSEVYCEWLLEVVELYGLERFERALDIVHEQLAQLSHSSLEACEREALRLAFGAFLRPEKALDMLLDANILVDAVPDE
jgi:hypothetical protein